MVDVIHLLFQKLHREYIPPIITIFPYFENLSRVFIKSMQGLQRFCFILCLQLADDLSRRMSFEITHHIYKCVFIVELTNEMNVIGHDHEYKQLHAPVGAQEMQAIEENTNHRFTLEEMGMPFSLGCYKVQMVWIKVGMNWHITLPRSGRGLAPARALCYRAVFNTFNARSVTHSLGCFILPKSNQVLPA